MKFFYFILTFLLANVTNGARILVVLPSAAIDFHNFYRPVVRKLAEKHELVVVTSQPLNFQSTHIKVYELAGLRELWDDGATRLIGQYALPYLQRLTNLHLDMAKFILDHPGVQPAFDSTQRYDLVVVEFFGHSPLYALARRFNCPLVGLAPNDEIDHEAVGNMWNYYHYPHPALQVGGWIEPKQGIYAVWAALYKRWFIDWPANAARDRMIKAYFGSQISTTKDLAQNVDLVVMDAPPLLHMARPITQVVQQHGWFHIDKTPPKLPKEIDTFLTTSQHGVIYINFNSEFFSKPTVVNQKHVVMYLTVVQTTEYDILCNWDNETTPPITERVKYVRGVSQQAILNHSKVILFMAEPSIRNMEEAVWYKKPMLSLLNGVERNMNDWHIEWSDIGRALFRWDMTEKGIYLKLVQTMTTSK